MKIVKNFAYLLSLKMMSQIMLIAVSIFVARGLGPEGKGIWALVLLLPEFAMRFSTLGIEQANVYFLGRKKYEDKEIVGSNIIWGIILGLAAAIIFGVVAYFGYDKFLHGVDKRLVYTSLLLLPIMMVNGFVSNIFLGRREYKKYGLINNFTSFFQFAVIGIFFLTNYITVTNLLAIRFAMFATALTISLVLIYRVMGISFKNSRKIFVEEVKYGAIKRIGSQLFYLNHRADFFMISYFLNPYQLGIYSIATALSEKVETVSNIMGEMVFADTSHDNESAKKNTPIIARNFLIIILATSALIIIAAPILVGALYGKEYSGAIRPFIFLIIGLIVLSYSRALGSDLSGRGYPQESIYSGLPAFAVNVILNIILTPRLGIIGAAFSSMVSYSVAGIIRMILFIRITKTAFRDIIWPKKEDWIYYQKIFGMIKGVFKK